MKYKDFIYMIFKYDLYIWFINMIYKYDLYIYDLYKYDFWNI